METFHLRPRTRPTRVQTPLIPTRIGSSYGLLLNISPTGALVRTERPQRVGIESSLLFEVEDRTVEIRARIARCEPVAIQLAGAMLQRHEYLLGVAFTGESPDGRQMVSDLCRGTPELEEIPYRVLIVGDDMTVNEEIGWIVRQAGGVARMLADPSSALNVARDVRPDAVIVTGGRETSSSWWVTIESLAGDAMTSAIPIILLTDTPAIGPARLEYLRARRAQLLPMPIVPSALLRLLGGTTESP